MLNEDELEKLVNTVVRRLHRVAGDAQYGSMPQPGTAALEDLKGDVQLAALEADAGGQSWENSADAGYNAGRRFLYKLDAEVPDSFIGTGVDAEDGQPLPSVVEQGGLAGSGRGTPAGPGMQPWEVDEHDEERADRPGRVLGAPGFDPRLLVLEMRVGRGEVGEPEQTIVQMWHSPAKEIGEVTGLSAAVVRQRKHRLLESVPAGSSTQDPTISPPFVVRNDEEHGAVAEELAVLPRTFSPTGDVTP